MGRRTSLQVAKDRAETLAFKLQAEQSKVQIAAIKRSYDAAKVSSLHPRRGDSKSGNSVMQHAGNKIRNYARYLDENHDIAIGILDDLVNKIIGAESVYQPMIKKKNGELNNRVNEVVKALRKEWENSRPESSRSIPWNQTRRLACRAWLRDGEQLVQHLEGSAPIKHLSKVPYSIEMIEADYLPFDLHNKNRSKGVDNNVVHGIEINGWKQSIAYHLFKHHPGDIFSLYKTIDFDTKRVDADKISHLKFVRRFDQLRGVSIFHGILQRLDDIKDYEESERIAARVAAAMTGFIKKSADFAGGGVSEVGQRMLEMNPGMIFDNLMPGEDIGTIGSDRPNSGLQDFRNSQLRAASAGTGSSYSSVSNDYNGTYSAQRQEMVENVPSYAAARNYFTDMFDRDCDRRFIDMAILTGLIPLADVDLSTIYDADYGSVSIPWIDPIKEAKASKVFIDEKIKSRQQVIHEHGGDPSLVDKQIQADIFYQQDQEEKQRLSDQKEAEINKDKETKPEKEDEEVAA